MVINGEISPNNSNFPGIPVTVVMPVVAPIMKIQNCKNYGATVIIHGQDIGESRLVAFSLCFS